MKEKQQNVGFASQTGESNLTHGFSMALIFLMVSYLPPMFPNVL